jgi:rRNA processing protein Gar1
MTDTTPAQRITAYVDSQAGRPPTAADLRAVLADNARLTAQLAEAQRDLATSRLSQIEMVGKLAEAVHEVGDVKAKLAEVGRVADILGETMPPFGMLDQTTRAIRTAKAEAHREAAEMIRLALETRAAEPPADAIGGAQEGRGGAVAGLEASDG